MDELKAQLNTVLGELRDQIILFSEQEMWETANTLLDQYAKLAPQSVEAYSLEAMIRMGEGNADRAQEVLQEGLTHHPMSFDLLYNSGHVYQGRGNLFEAYNMYMKARYVASEGPERADVGSMVKDIKGTVKSRGDKISSVVHVGDKVMTFTAETRVLLQRKGILSHIERHIDRHSTSVLDIGFQDGIISKNLNYYGYDVTAVDRHRERMLQVMALEWHDSILQSEQDVAKFYYELMDLKWVEQIPKFDVIVAVCEENLKVFDTSRDQAKEVLGALLEKAGRQLFITVTEGESKPDEFTREELNRVASDLGAGVQSLGTVGAGDGALELCVVNTDAEVEAFEIPLAGDVIHSKSTVFEVELNKCTDLYGAGYVGDFQHFVEVLREYEANPVLKYDDSVLKAYYDSFLPKNTEEALFARRGRAPKLSRGWIGLPWLYDKTQRMAFSRSPGETRPGGNHHFGPNTQEFGKEELGRLKPLYKIFAEQGYHPELFFDGYITGHLISW